MWPLWNRKPHIMLVLCSPVDSRRTIELPSNVGLVAKIGRSEDADVVVRGSLVSRQHCELHDCEGAIVVRDVGSRNGTYVNGELVEQQDLKAGDVILIGWLLMEVRSLRPASVAIDECPESQVCVEP